MTRRTPHPLLAAAGLAALLLIAPPAAPADNGTLQKIKASGGITLGVRESSIPLSYLDAAQQPVGYHIDICNRIVEAIKAHDLKGLSDAQLRAKTGEFKARLAAGETLDDLQVEAYVRGTLPRAATYLLGR